MIGALARQQGRWPIRRRGLSVDRSLARRGERERRRERSDAILIKHCRERSPPHEARAEGMGARAPLNATCKGHGQVHPAHAARAH
eukprot:909884-Alexandrium_andersonii.AAC.1